MYIHTVFCRVTFHRCKGQRLTTAQFGPPVRGWLALDVLTDGVGGARQLPLNRLTLLEPCGSVKRTAAALMHPALVHLGDGVLVFRGVELVSEQYPDTGGQVMFEFGQAWHCTVLPESGSGGYVRVFENITQHRAQNHR